MARKTINPTDPKIQKALDLAEQLQEIGAEYGFNPFQPGAMKEIKTAQLLGHKWILSKKDADACNEDESEVYEYLSGKEGGAGQIDRVFKDGPENTEQHEKHEKSMERIRRNTFVYLAYTNKDTAKPLDILRIYRLNPKIIVDETKRQLAKSRNEISHVAFDEKFATDKDNGGVLVYSKTSRSEKK